MSKEKIWTLRPPENIERLVNDCVGDVGTITRTDLIIMCLLFEVPLLQNNPGLFEHFKREIPKSP